jgi:hypothetical protein
MQWFHLIALLTGFLGSLSIYLTSPNQLWLNQPFAKTTGLLVGALFWIVCLALLMQGLQVVVAIFIFVVWIMVVLTLLPYIGALKKIKSKGVE